MRSIAYSEPSGQAVSAGEVLRRSAGRQVMRVHRRLELGSPIRQRALNDAEVIPPHLVEEVGEPIRHVDRAPEGPYLHVGDL